MSILPTKRTTPSKRRRRVLAGALAAASFGGAFVGGATPAHAFPVIVIVTGAMKYSDGTVVPITDTTLASTTLNWTCSDGGSGAGSFNRSTGNFSFEVPGTAGSTCHVAAPAYGNAVPAGIDFRLAGNVFTADITLHSVTYTGNIGVETGSALSPDLGVAFSGPDTPTNRVRATIDQAGGTYLVHLAQNTDFEVSYVYLNGATQGSFGLDAPAISPQTFTTGLTFGTAPSVVYPTGQVTGLVENADGSVGAGLTVRLTDALGAPAADRLGGVVPAATVASDGTYSFRDLGPGNFKVVVDSLNISKPLALDLADHAVLDFLATPTTTTTDPDAPTTTTPSTTTDAPTTTTPATTTTTPSTTTTTPAPPATVEPTMALDSNLPQTRIADTRGVKKLTPATSPWRIHIGMADAAVLQLTTTDAEAAGYLTAYPCTAAVPVASNINFTPGDPKSALTTVKLEKATGDICIYASSPVNLIVDRMAVYGSAEASASGRFIPTDLARILDTRLTANRFAAGSTRTITIPGLPADAASVSINLTAVNADGGYLTAFKGGLANPGTSNLNVSAGKNAANAVVVPVGPGGTIQIFSSAGADVLVDYNGYFTNGSAAVSATGLFVPLDPTRVFDTRATKTAWAKDEVRFVTLRVPTTALRVVGTLTMISDTDGYATAWLKGVMPATSDVNFTAGTPAPNMVTVDLSRSQFKLYSSSAADAIFDIAGYFTS